MAEITRGCLAYARGYTTSVIPLAPPRPFCYSRVDSRTYRVLALGLFAYRDSNE